MKFKSIKVIPNVTLKRIAVTIERQDGFRFDFEVSIDQAFAIITPLQEAIKRIWRSN